MYIYIIHTYKHKYTHLFTYIGIQGLASFRVLFENNYGEANQYFPVMNYYYKTKLMAATSQKEIFFCKVLLRNCYVMMYHNKTSNRFNVDPPTLAQWFHNDF